MTNEEFIESISLEGEEWRDVVGYEGLYMVSSFGRVISLQREVRNGISSKKIVPFALKTPTLCYTTKNYKRYIVTLSKNRKKKTFLLHRIVADSFIENKNNYPEIDHIDGNPLNNIVSNLRRCNRQMNMNNPISRHRNSMSKKGKYNTKKSKKVIQLKGIVPIQVFNSASDAGRNGFNYTCVGQCCRGENTLIKATNRCTYPTFKPLSVSQRTPSLSLRMTNIRSQSYIRCCTRIHC